MFRLLVILGVFLLPFGAVADERVAFIVGNSTYENAPPLPNPANDSRLVGRTLETLGFKVYRHANLSRWEIAAELSIFLKETEGADLTLFYFAGHGMQFEGRNYLLGTDAELRSEFDIQAEALDLGQVTRVLRKNSRAALIFVDACRDNPVATNFYRRTLPATRAAAVQGLAAPSERFDGAMLTFSASPGQVAYDGRGSYSPFAQALATHLPTPNIEILTLMKRVIGDVRDKTDDRQVPMVSNDLSREIYLLEEAALPVPEPEVAAPATPPAPEDLKSDEELAFEAAKSMKTLHGWARFFTMYPLGEFTKEALEAEHEILMREASYLAAGLDRARPLDEITPRLASQFEKLMGIDRQDVIAIQALLKREGHYAGALDGAAGPGTRGGLKEFQDKTGLPATGMITRATASALGLTLPKLANRPRFSSFRRIALRRPDVEALRMDDRLFAHLPEYYSFAQLVYGYRGNRLYLVTNEYFAASRSNPRNVPIGATVYPVAIGSADENKFVYDLSRFERGFWSTNDDWHSGPLIGLWQPDGSREPRSGWRFTGDESSTYRRWDRGQPDNHDGRQNYARMWVRSSVGLNLPELANGPYWDDVTWFPATVILEVE